jgi:predicted permease
MDNLILLAVSFTAGLLMRRSGRMPEDAPSVLNAFIINVSLPAMVLNYLHGLHFRPEMLLSASMPWVAFGLSALFFIIAGRLFRLPSPTVGALILCGGLGNTSFFGFPMIEAFYGREGIVHGIIVDQLGSFMVVSILGVTVAGIYSHGRPDAWAMLRRVLLFPSFIAVVAAILLNDVTWPSWFTVLVRRLSDMLAPMALFSVGFRFSPGHIGGTRGVLALGLVFKLVLSPALLFMLYVGAAGMQGLAARITIFEAAMPTMITAGIIATEYRLDPPLANLMVSLGLLVSFATLALWSLLLGSV